MNIFDCKHIHFTGIKGVAMTALALCAQDLQIGISGSDIEEEFVTDEILKERGITWSVGFSPDNLVPKPSLLITTGAHGGLNNPEVLAAKEMGIPVLTHAEALSKFSSGKNVVTVCGVGGKTTTASMIAHLLATAGKRPSFAIGVGNIFPLGTPGRFEHKGKEFVTEADEFAVSPGIDNRPRFIFQNPKLLVVTNIEHDHPDIYPSFEDTKKVFLEFINKVPQDGLLLACIDNENVRELLKKVNRSMRVQTYGYDKKADWVIDEMGFELNIPGSYNKLNAAAAIAACKFIGVDMDSLKAGIQSFEGCKRRIEKVGEKKGVLYYDDYAHNPHEIASVLQAVKESFPGKRIVCSFQPHTYSRTKRLLKEFSKSFKDADLVGIVDVYSSSRETDTLGMNSKILAGEIKKSHSKPKQVNYVGNLKDLAKALKSILKSGDICITLGAGDIYKIHRQLV